KTPFGTRTPRSSAPSHTVTCSPASSVRPTRVRMTAPRASTITRCTELACGTAYAIAIDDRIGFGRIGDINCARGVERCGGRTAVSTESVQRAMYNDCFPPALVKSPPAYRFPSSTESACTGWFTPEPSALHAAPSHRAMLEAGAPAVEKSPAAISV